MASLLNAINSILGVSTLCAVPAQGGNAGFPNKPIRLIVPGVAGGPGQIIATAIAEKLSVSLKQQVNIEPGLSQVAGLLAAARAPADGYTLAMGGGSYYISDALYKKLPFDPQNDFAPVNLAASIANVLVVHPSVPVHSVSEFIAYAHAHPGELRYGSSGHGSPPHIAGEMFKQLAKVDLVHVPYKGHVAAGNALAEGRDLQVMFDAVPTAIPHLKSGEMRGLGVTTSRRLPVMPDIPTIAECGLPGYDMNPAMGVIAPAAIPVDIAQRLSEEIGRIMALPDVKAHLQGIGIEAISTTRDYFASYRKGQFAKWAQVLRDTGIESLDSAP